MNLSRHPGLLILFVAGAALAGGCELGLEHEEATRALSNEEIENEKEVMCDAYGCETEVSKENGYPYDGECKESWARWDDTECDLEARVTRTTITYRQLVPLFKHPKGDPPRCEFSVNRWTVTYETPIPAGQECEDGDGADGDGG